jgi:hypothetical protein
MRRVGISAGERDKMVATLKTTKNWDEAVAHITDVDRKILDDGFKKWAHEKAGVPLPGPVKPDPLK